MSLFSNLLRLDVVVSLLLLPRAQSAYANKIPNKIQQHEHNDDEQAFSICNFSFGHGQCDASEAIGVGSGEGGGTGRYKERNANDRLVLVLIHLLHKKIRLRSHLVCRTVTPLRICSIIVSIIFISCFTQRPLSGATFAQWLGCSETEVGRAIGHLAIIVCFVRLP